MKPLPIALVVLAAICAVIGVLYGIGTIQVFTSTGQGHHTTHLILFIILAVLCLVGANFARRRAV